MQNCQLTWFRRERDVTWVDRTAFAGKEDEMLAFMLGKVDEMRMGNMV